MLAVADDDPEEEERSRSRTESGQLWINLQTDWTGTS